MPPQQVLADNAIGESVGQVVGSVTDVLAATITLIALPFKAMALSVSWVPEVASSIEGAVG